MGVETVLASAIGVLLGLVCRAINAVCQITSPVIHSRAESGTMNGTKPRWTVAVPAHSLAGEPHVHPSRPDRLAGRAPGP
ncbi:hypothetical protein ACFFX0_00040 [Citricoccus parietis]|uniref:Uncharacterized protein n=1 Tax=Citricoccus parietis TaxID=592307 RepID=A0ABV5FSM3_9MICC